MHGAVGAERQRGADGLLVARGSERQRHDLDLVAGLAQADRFLHPVLVHAVDDERDAIQIHPGRAGPYAGFGVGYLLQDGYQLHSFLQWPQWAGCFLRSTRVTAREALI